MAGMKILITTDWYEPVINGVVTSVVTLKEQLERLGCEVRVVTLSGNGHAYRDGDVYYLPSVNASRIYPGARAVCPPCRGIGELFAWKPDLIHSQCEFSSFLIAKWIGEHRIQMYNRVILLRIKGISDPRRRKRPSLMLQRMSHAAPSNQPFSALI